MAENNVNVSHLKNNNNKLSYLHIRKLETEFPRLFKISQIKTMHGFEPIAKNENCSAFQRVCKNDLLTSGKMES